MAYLIGVDIGTSGTKTVLFRENGETVASSTAEYPLYQPCIGWAEQRAEDWWEATCRTVGEVLAKSGIDAAEVVGLGLSGQMHGLVMLDREDRVLRPAIIWCDQRTQKQCDEMTDLLGDKLIGITANPALTGFTAGKILWVRENEPEIYEKCTKILLPKDYVRYMLTGEFATEVSDASGMQLMDIRRRCWSGEVLDILCIDRSLLGTMYESCEITGSITARAAKLTGLKEGTPVVGGAGDNAAGAVGNGIVRQGVAFSTVGTSGVVFAHTDEPLIDAGGRVHTFCHAVPGAWHIMGVMQSAGLSLKWFRDNFSVAETEAARLMGVDPYVLMDKEAERVPAGSRGVIYLPYLMGERTPHLDSRARGVFFGLSAAHTRADMLRAVMEGVGYAMTDSMDIIRELGSGVSEVRAGGGGGRSPLWRQIQADMFGCQVCTTTSSEGPALGVALLAAVGTGVYSSVPEACEATVRLKSAQQPSTETAAVYAKYHPLYKKLYSDLKESYRILEKLQ